MNYFLKLLSVITDKLIYLKGLPRSLQLAYEVEVSFILKLSFRQSGG